LKIEIEERGGWIGEYDIIILYKDGTVERERIKNRLTNAGLNLPRDGFLGTVSDMKLKYLALGDSTLAIDDTHTQLGNERFRTAWIGQQATGTGQLQSTALVLDTEAVFNIQEIGIFAGSTATDAANTGIMVSRILWSRNKTNLESIQFVRTDTIGRG
jgi:hypothetical protein